MTVRMRSQFEVRRTRVDDLLRRRDNRQKVRGGPARAGFVIRRDDIPPDVAVGFLRPVFHLKDLRVLADGTRQRLYAEGEVVVKRGDRTTDLFVVHTGKVRVVVPGAKGEAPEEVAQIGPGHFFGEMALMTGEPRRATIIAAEDSELYVIGHAELHAVLANHPEFATSMARTIAERQAKLDAHESVKDRESVVDERTNQILDKVRSFFSL